LGKLHAELGFGTISQKLQCGGYIRQINRSGELAERVVPSVRTLQIEHGTSGRLEQFRIEQNPMTTAMGSRPDLFAHAKTLAVRNGVFVLTRWPGFRDRVQDAARRLQQLAIYADAQANQAQHNE
jgi:hypothetical protein